MEIVKHNEVFMVTDVTDTYTVEGSVDVSVDGTFNLILDFRTLEGEFIGNGAYNKYPGNNHIHYCVNCSEELFATVSGYVNESIAKVQEYFNK